jgi:hypothetical protein
MRGYPKGPLSKSDYENLLAMPEHADQAKASLEKLAATDDSKITVDQGTQDAPKLVQITNPLPVWKRAGFRDKAELSSAAIADVKPLEEDMATINEKV